MEVLTRYRLKSAVFTPQVLVRFNGSRDFVIRVFKKTNSLRTVGCGFGVIGSKLLIGSGSIKATDCERTGYSGCVGTRAEI
jgi:hypothetical protein